MTDDEVLILKNRAEEAEKQLKIIENRENAEKFSNFVFSISAEKKIPAAIVKAMMPVLSGMSESAVIERLDRIAEQYHQEVDQQVSVKTDQIYKNAGRDVVIGQAKKTYTPDELKALSENEFRQYWQEQVKKN